MLALKFGQSTRAQIQDMGLNQFIWDFVIDMSPLKFSEPVTQTASNSAES